MTQVATPILEFRGVLPPFDAGGHVALSAYAQTPPPPSSQAGSGGVILNALWPLGGELQRALAAGEARAALEMAYHALSRLCNDLAKAAGSPEPGADQVRIHALLIELQPLLLACHADGTLAPAGASVFVQYRNWLVAAEQAAILAEALIERCQNLWPNVWIIR